MNTKELTYKQIIRNINISILTNTEIKEPYLSIYNELKEVFFDLNIYMSDEYPHLTYYGVSKGDLYVEYDSKNEHIWLDRTNVRSKLKSKYSLSDECIQGITTWYLGNTFQMKGTTNHKYFLPRYEKLGNTFQMKMSPNSQL